MVSFKSAKLYFCFAVLFLVAKPFLGFSMFSRVHPPADESIFVKSFTKRLQEYSEDSNSDINAVQKRLADPVNLLFLRFTFFLSILFPLVFEASTNLTNSFLNGIHFRISPRRHTYLLNGKLII
jgi:hypothetical protein